MVYQEILSDSRWLIAELRLALQKEVILLDCAPNKKLTQLLIVWEGQSHRKV